MSYIAYHEQKQEQADKFAKGGIITGKPGMLPEPEEFVVPHGQMLKIIGLDDIVQVVRCKDCKYRHTFSSGHTICNRHFPYLAKDNDFCSYGERKDNEVVKKA